MKKDKQSYGYLQEMEAEAGPSLIEELKNNFNKAGIFKVESPHLNSMFQSLVVAILYVREKAYALKVLFKKCSDSGWEFGFKIAAKGAIPRARVSKYTYKDFSRMCDTRTPPVYAENLYALRRKAFELFQVRFKRKELTIFSRKRFLKRAGQASVPFHYYKSLRADCDKDEHLKAFDII